MSSHSGVLVAWPWSKIWQLRGARHRAGLRPEQAGGLAIPSGSAALGATMQRQRQQRAELVAFWQWSCPLPKGKMPELQSSMPLFSSPTKNLALAPPDPFQEKQRWGHVRCCTAVTFVWHFTEAGTGCEHFWFPVETMSQLLGKPGAHIHSVRSR